MTDRELLEAAAKAAGVVIEHWNENVPFCGWRAPRAWWTPLTDDGDALRLAVKLRINLNFEEWDGAEYACTAPHKSHQGQDEVIGDDENAAARRAIVRAAAAMAA